MRYLKLALGITIALVLTACASWHKYNYKGQGEQVASVDAVQVPQNMDHHQPMREYYPIPPVVHKNYSRSKAAKAATKS